MASSALLAQIQQGRSLKKAATNDRSAPIVDAGPKSSGGGRGIGGIGGAISNGVGRPAASSSSGMAPGAGGAPQLGGLFAGGMPKLKPSGFDSTCKSRLLLSTNYILGSAHPIPLYFGPTIIRTMNLDIFTLVVNNSLVS